MNVVLIGKPHEPRGFPDARSFLEHGFGIATVRVQRENLFVVFDSQFGWVGVDVSLKKSDDTSVVLLTKQLVARIINSAFGDLTDGDIGDKIPQGLPHAVSFEVSRKARVDPRALSRRILVRMMSIRCATSQTQRRYLDSTFVLSAGWKPYSL